MSKRRLALALQALEVSAGTFCTTLAAACQAPARPHFIPDLNILRRPDTRRSQAIRPLGVRPLSVSPKVQQGEFDLAGRTGQPLHLSPAQQRSPIAAIMERLIGVMQVLPYSTRH
ncbi:hypothetical protein HNQ66_000890 [Shinella fusca]|jgi:hypothetical protein|uniref:Uncharacterized protein n=1 Tax=Shinella fusca TaxID=544480 RepID=A0A7W8DTG9_9HYPH|nr:hypothetical protein [Shinella fusca]